MKQKHSLLALILCAVMILSGCADLGGYPPMTTAPDTKSPDFTDQVTFADSTTDSETVIYISDKPCYGTVLSVTDHGIIVSPGGDHAKYDPLLLICDEAFAYSEGQVVNYLSDKEPKQSGEDGSYYLENVTVYME